MWKNFLDRYLMNCHSVPNNSSATAEIEWRISQKYNDDICLPLCLLFIIWPHYTCHCEVHQPLQCTSSYKLWNTSCIFNMWLPLQARTRLQLITVSTRMYECTSALKYVCMSIPVHESTCEWTYMHCEKSFSGFPSPAGMSVTKLSLAGNNLPNPSPRKVWSKQIQESRTFFLQCNLRNTNHSPKCGLEQYFLTQTSLTKRNHTFLCTVPNWNLKLRLGDRIPQMHIYIWATFKLCVLR